MACCIDETTELIEAQRVRKHVYLDVQLQTDLNTYALLTQVCLPALQRLRSRSTPMIFKLQLVLALPFMGALPGALPAVLALMLALKLIPMLV